MPEEDFELFAEFLRSHGIKVEKLELPEEFEMIKIRNPLPIWFRNTFLHRENDKFLYIRELDGSVLIDYGGVKLNNEWRRDFVCEGKTEDKFLECNIRIGADKKEILKDIIVGLLDDTSIRRDILKKKLGEVL
jgi:hypothetical protein